MGPVELRANALRLALAFVLSSGNGSANALQVIDTHSLLSGPALQARLLLQSPELRMGETPALLRLSAGIEPAGDLVADVRDGLERALKVDQ